MSEKRPWANPSLFNKILGTLVLFALLALAFQDLAPGQEASPTIAAILGLIAVILLGFGALVRYVAEAKYGYGYDE